MTIEDFITQLEGVRLKVYDDATGQPIVPGSHVVGHPTIGIGRALDTNGITVDEANYLLFNSLTAIEKQLDADLPWWVKLSENKQMVIQAMAYQLGVAGLLEFKHFLAAAEAGDDATAIDELLNSKAASQTPHRYQQLAGLWMK